MPASPPLAALLLATAAVLLAASASPAAADKHGGGRMVIIRAAGTRVVVSAPGDRSRWRQRHLVEAEAAPEFGGGLLLGAGGGTQISYQSLINEKPACGDSCAGRGHPYTRPCTYKDQCGG